MDVLARDLPAELENFAHYSRSVAGDTAGPARLTWQERAEWADACAAAARGAVEAVRAHRDRWYEANSKSPDEARPSDRELWHVVLGSDVPGGQ